MCWFRRRRGGQAGRPPLCRRQMAQVRYPDQRQRRHLPSDPTPQQAAGSILESRAFTSVERARPPCSTQQQQQQQPARPSHSAHPGKDTGRAAGCRRSKDIKSSTAIRAVTTRGRDDGEGALSCGKERGEKSETGAIGRRLRCRRGVMMGVVGPGSEALAHSRLLIHQPELDLGKGK